MYDKLLTVSYNTVFGNNLYKYSFKNSDLYFGLSQGSILGPPPFTFYTLPLR